MTSTVFFDSLISIVADLPKDLPTELRYQNLLDAMQRNFPCDAAALLKLEGDTLKPLAVDGLSSDTMGRRFVVDDHPRLAHLLLSREPVRFPADSELPDPYDGLVDGIEHHLEVHDCMGASLYIDDKPWGVLTLDALKRGTFDDIDPIELRTFISLTEATVKAADRIERLEARVEREKSVIQALQKTDISSEILGQSPLMKQLKDEIDVVAYSPLTVLVLGETGVGKELVAKRVHLSSTRSNEPLVHVNCAALPENIVESELFGHVKGAYSGANSDRAGKFELADGGTLFLDEIGELPLVVQAKMLRALQSGEIQRVGSDNNIHVDVRIVAATNRDLQQEVSKGRFRADLYHRITVYPVTVPPLRDRGQDVILLAGFFLENNQKRLGISGLRLSHEARGALLSYHWPGNVRELEHLISRASLKAMAEQGRDLSQVIIAAKHLDLVNDGGYQDNNKLAIPVLAKQATGSIDLKDALDDFQRTLITERLQENDGNLAATARDLKLNSSNFYRLLKRLGIK